VDDGTGRHAVDVIQIARISPMTAGDAHPPAITVLYFAAASTATGRTSETITLPTSDPILRLSALGTLLVARYPNARLEDILKMSRWSVDAEMVDDPETVLLRGGEEVAIICPVSGG
jgi:molybdopterin synthase sulfur carrier subunit